MTSINDGSDNNDNKFMYVYNICVCTCVYIGRLGQLGGRVWWELLGEPAGRIRGGNALEPAH